MLNLFYSVSYIDGNIVTHENTLLVLMLSIAHFDGNVEVYLFL